MTMTMTMTSTMTSWWRWMGIVSVTLIVPVAAGEEEITVVTWNVESGGADVDVVQERIARFEGVDLWGLTEVRDHWVDDFERGAEAGEPGNFVPILGTTGNDDRLLILYDRRQFVGLEHFEIPWDDRYWHRPQLGPRSPLVLRLRHRATRIEFFFMVNHLYRGDGVDPRRLDQAKALREWAAEQALPVIAVGDYNFDYDLDAEDAAFNYQKGLGDLTSCGVFTWLRPEEMVTTHSSRYNSILDFVFLANARGRIRGTSRVVVEAGDFPDDDRTPDHRPVMATLMFREGGSN